MDRQNQLIAAAQNGSVAAFEKLIREVEHKMLSVAAGLALYPDEADDIYQEAMLTAYNVLPGYRGESQFTTWLYRICVNTALNYRRKLSNTLSRQHDGDSDHANCHEHYLGPEQDAENTQLSIAIQNAMMHLSENERVAFVLCHQQQLTISDTARIMVCSDGAVKSYLFRARDKLRRLLHEHKR